MKRRSGFKTDSEFIEYVEKQLDERIPESEFEGVRQEYQEALKNESKKYSKQSETGEIYIEAKEGEDKELDIEIDEDEQYDLEDEKEQKPKRAFLTYAGRGKDFLIIPMEVIICGKKLEQAEKILWLVLFRHDWNMPEKRWRVYPSVERLSVLMGCSESTVIRASKKLQKRGLLTAKKRLNRPNLYTLLDPPRAWIKETETLADEREKES